MLLLLLDCCWCCELPLNMPRYHQGPTRVNVSPLSQKSRKINEFNNTFTRRVVQLFSPSPFIPSLSCQLARVSITISSHRKIRLHIDDYDYDYVDCIIWASTSLSLSGGNKIVKRQFNWQLCRSKVPKMSSFSAVVEKIALWIASERLMMKIRTRTWICYFSAAPSTRNGRTTEILEFNSGLSPINSIPIRPAIQFKSMIASVQIHTTIAIVQIIVYAEKQNWIISFSKRSVIKVLKLFINFFVKSNRLGICVQIIFLLLLYADLMSDSINRFF